MVVDIKSNNYPPWSKFKETTVEFIIIIFHLNCQGDKSKRGLKLYTSDNFLLSCFVDHIDKPLCFIILIIQ